MKRKISSIDVNFGDAHFRLYQIQLAEEDRGPRVPVYHAHPYYEIHFAFQGEYAYRFPPQSVTLTAGKMMIIPPGVAHNTVLLDEDWCQHIALLLFLEKDEGADGFFDYFQSTLDQASLTPIAFSESLIRILPSFKPLFEDQQDYIRNYCLLSAKAAETIFTIFDDINHFFVAAQHGSPHGDRMDSLVLLESLVNNPLLRLDEIADKMNYSRRHTARLIKEMYGMTLAELRQKRNTENPLAKSDGEPPV